MTKISNDALRRAMVWCSQSKCIHGAEFRVKTTGKILCNHCAKLFNVQELTKLENK